MGLFSKGFINKLWSDTKDAAISTATTKVKTSFMDMLKTSVRNANSFNLFSNFLGGSFSAYIDSPIAPNNSFTSNYSFNLLNGNNDRMSSDLDPQSGVNKGIFNSNHLKVVDMPRAYSFENSKFDMELNEIKWKASIPDYGYDQFINERTIFQKGLHNFFGEPSYFYFKIFFKFDTQYGLLGGLLNNEEPTQSFNSAASYFNTLLSNTSASVRILPEERLLALRQFAQTLSYINTTAPWFFIGVKGLDKAGIPTIGDFSKEKTISIDCNEESIDMRLNTLFDLYKFVCYDEVNCKEILPDNLRKFDMSIMVFQSPIKKLHSAIRKGKTRYYNMPSTRSDKGNLMGFKLFEFIGCEFDINSLGSLIPSDMNNEKPFKMGKGSINISYNKCIKYNSNEFNKILFGDYGLFVDYDNSVNKFKISNNKDPYKLGEKRRELLADPSSSKLIDYNEQYTVNNLMKLSRFTLGNIYGEDYAYKYYKDSDSNEKENNKYTPMGKYVVAHPANNKSFGQTIGEIGINYISKWLHLAPSNSSGLGWLGGEEGGYAMSAVGGPVWVYQMQKLTSRYKHQFTTPPTAKYIKNDFSKPIEVKGFEYLVRADTSKKWLDSIRDISKEWTNYDPDLFAAAIPEDQKKAYNQQYFKYLAGGRRFVDYSPNVKNTIKDKFSNNKSDDEVNSSSKLNLNNIIHQYDEWLNWKDKLTSNFEHKYTTKPTSNQ